MKVSLSIIFFSVFSLKLFSQVGDTKEFSEYFKEFQKAAKESESLWNKNLYGPILLVDPATRKVYANFPDSAGKLTNESGIYTGYLPKEVNIANTQKAWSGVNWAMIILPLSKDKVARTAMFAHESFHRVQEELGLKIPNADNNHLDEKEGRIYFRLELEALGYALASKNNKELSKHIRNALLFRLYRHALYKHADSLENQLELNEGLAEYTATMVIKNPEDIIAYRMDKNKSFVQNNPTFVRSFAYETIPVYGYFLSKTNKGWHRSVTANTSLTALFVKAFNIKMPVDLNREVVAIKAFYNNEKINLEETTRDRVRLAKLKFLRQKFIDNPHADLTFVTMSISFNPGNLIPLENKGTVYPNLRVSDKWGILEVFNEALVSADWTKVTVSQPNKFEGNIIQGDGWKLELKEGWKLEKQESTGNYYLKKM